MRGDFGILHTIHPHVPAPTPLYESIRKHHHHHHIGLNHRLVIRLLLANEITGGIEITNLRDRDGLNLWGEA